MLNKIIVILKFQLKELSKNITSLLHNFSFVLIQVILIGLASSKTEIENSYLLYTILFVIYINNSILTANIIFSLKQNSTNFLRNLILTGIEPSTIIISVSILHWFLNALVFALITPLILALIQEANFDIQAFLITIFTSGLIISCVTCFTYFLLRNIKSKSVVNILNTIIHFILIPTILGVLIYLTENNTSGICIIIAEIFILLPFMLFFARYIV